VKYLTTQLAYLLEAPQLRRNLASLLRYVASLIAVTLVFAVLFHVIMESVEGREHSWLTGLYWVLTVMSTLGFGDITFTSDIGRLFSIVVLLTGIIMLIIVLPFAFIKLFYAPWIEAKIHTRAPREVPEEARRHVVICRHDPIARDLIDRLRRAQIPYWVVERDAAAAAELVTDGLAVVAGDVESSATWNALRVRGARAVIANLGDAQNTNVTLTVRQVAPDVPVLATADEEDSVDILQLAGATEVLPLKQRLGEHLANRVNAGHAEAHEIGRFRGLVIAEFPVQNTPWVGKTIRDTQIRKMLGITVVGVWERGAFAPARPETALGPSSVVVIIGTPEQILELNAALAIYNANYNPVVVIGAGKVGQATARALRRREMTVHLVEKDATLAARAHGAADKLIVGDAADRDVLMSAGLADAPAVILSTNDDSTNIYLAVYCRRLNPDLHIVSRITHDRNLEAIHRAGADFVLSYSSLGAESAFSVLQGCGLMMLGAGVDLFEIPVPPSMAGKTLGETKLGELTGMNVIVVTHGAEIVTTPTASSVLPADGQMLMLGSAEQRNELVRRFR
jgi:Trk K+ transport system NAD-binding subunit